MLIIAYIIFGFAVLQLMVALSNLVFNQALPVPDKYYQPLISVLIPARNEEENIGTLLSDLEKQAYQNLEILVFNDQSEDNTAAIVEDFAQKNNKIKLYHSSGLPDGWMGKTHGCYQLAEKAHGAYFLFIDADVRISGDIIHQTVTKAKKHKLGLLTIFPKQIIKSWGEYLMVPNMNYILLTLLPLILVRKSGFTSLSAANGQFMLFEAETYRQNQPHKTHRTSRVEDISIARTFKQSNIPIACLAGTNDIRCHMYSGFREAINGFSKNIIMFFGNSSIMAIIFWLFTSIGFVFIVFELPIVAFIVYLLILLFIRIIVSVISRQHILKNVMLGYMQKMVMGYVIFRAIRSQNKNTFEWKGRKIS